jgi:predicted phosphodiesterase
MRIGFLSDVHGNWEALSACLRDSETEGLSKLFFLGDAVGYGADPNLVVEKISEICEVSILGNHDAAAIGQLSPEYFNEYARASHYYTVDTLTKTNLSILKKSVLTAGWERFTMVHALPKDPESWGYVLTLREADENFEHFDSQVCLIGHSHRPFIVEKCGDKYSNLLPATSLVLEKECRYIINVGSVGQPRDGNPNACYLIFDNDTGKVTFKRLKYDIESAQRKMRESQIPKYLVDRLKAGR